MILQLITICILHFLVWYLSERVTASKKYTWIHNDFETTKYSIDRLRQYLNCVDQFFAVSNQLVKEFINIFPEFKEKISTALNIVPKIRNCDEVRNVLSRGV